MKGVFCEATILKLSIEINFHVTYTVEPKDFRATQLLKPGRSLEEPNKFEAELRVFFGRNFI